MARVYVAEFGRNTIGVIDTATDTKVASFQASHNTAARTHAVWPSHDGRTVYATNEVTNDIAAIDARRASCCEPLRRHASQRNTGHAQRPHRFVTVRGEEVDLTARALTGREAVVSVQPDTMQLTFDQALVVALRGPSPVATVALVDTRTPELDVTSVPVPGTTTGHQWLSRTGRYTFVAVEGPVGVSGRPSSTTRQPERLPRAGAARRFCGRRRAGRAAVTEGPARVRADHTPLPEA